MSTSKIKKETNATVSETSKIKKETKPAVSGTSKIKKETKAAVSETSKIKKETKTAASRSSKVKKEAKTAVPENSETKKKTKTVVPETSETKKKTKTAVPETSEIEKETMTAVSETPDAEKETVIAVPDMPAEEKIKILYVSPEAVPFSGTGGLGDVAGSLPRALNRKKGFECRVITPLYKRGDEYRAKMKFLGHKDIPVSWRQKYMGVFELKHNGVIYYFIDNEEYFKRDGTYGFYDDCERFAFFSRAVYECLDFIDYVPDIIHANDWQTSLVPIYQDAIYHREFMKTVLTIHNIEYQGQYGREVIGDVLGLPQGSEHLVEFEGGVNLLKGGITTANYVNTVSPTYAQQLHDPFFAHGLQNVISENAYKMRGILNGIDTVLYDPEKDDLIAKQYSKKDPSGKAECKKALQEELDLPVKDVPMITMISRLVAHKGVDIIRDSIEGIIQNNDVQFVLLGTGDHEYEEFFRYLEGKYRSQVRSLILFNRAMSHKVYAAGDILLMPSKSEPCGLSQMIACRYGNVPLVRATGGLNDSIKDCTLGDGNGFVFGDYTADALYHTMDKAVKMYSNKEDWAKLVKHDLGEDFSWSNAATHYTEMYKDILG